MQNDKPPLDVEEHVTEQVPIYYYSHAHRLEKAAPSVRELNDPEAYKKRGSLWHLFVMNKSNPNRLLLLSIVMICAMISFVTIFTKEKSGFKLGGNSISVSAMRFEGMTYLSVKKTLKEPEAYTGPVQLAVTPIIPGAKQIREEDMQVLFEQLVFTQQEEENYRFSLPFDASHVLVLLQTEHEQLSLTIKPK